MDAAEYRESLSQAFARSAELVTFLGYLLLGVILLAIVLYLLVYRWENLLSGFRGWGVVPNLLGGMGGAAAWVLPRSFLRWEIASLVASTLFLRYLALGLFRPEDDWFTTEHRQGWCWTPEIAEIVLAATLRVHSVNRNPSQEALAWAYDQNENTPFGRRVRHIATCLRNEQWRRQQGGGSGS